MYFDAFVQSYDKYLYLRELRINIANAHNKGNAKGINIGATKRIFLLN
jgi:hypothetical protein